MNNTFETRTIKRGDIYTYDFGENEGSIQSGLRPVLVLQNSGLNAKCPTIIVAAITTAIKKQYMPTHIVLGKRFGLDDASMVMLEQSRSVNATELKRFVGHIDNDYINRSINIGIKKLYGLWVERPRKENDIRCLCPKCLEDYKTNPNINIRRLDPFCNVREKCDKCSGLGYDYIIFRKDKKGHHEHK